MKCATRILLSAVMVLGSVVSVSAAEPMPTKQLDIAALPGKNVWKSDATVTPLAFDANGKPAIVVIKVPAGQQAKAAHATKDGNIRFATVLSGTLYYADGESVDKAKEKAYPAGSVLAISSGVKHWVSTRESALTLLLTAADPDKLSPMVKKQFGMM
ncbi:MAG: hypothetical protein OIF54_07985 [Cohaesibacter sp.]|nr:hypothetical protein [Cohaesibacter sp.]